MLPLLWLFEWGRGCRRGTYSVVARAMLVCVPYRCTEVTVPLLLQTRISLSCVEARAGLSPHSSPLLILVVWWELSVPPDRTTVIIVYVVHNCCEPEFGIWPLFS